MHENRTVFGSCWQRDRDQKIVYCVRSSQTVVCYNLATTAMQLRGASLFTPLLVFVTDK